MKQPTARIKEEKKIKNIEVYEGNLKKKGFRVIFVLYCVQGLNLRKQSTRT